MKVTRTLTDRVLNIQIHNETIATIQTEGNSYFVLDNNDTIDCTKIQDIKVGDIITRNIYEDDIDENNPLAFFDSLKVEWFIN